jgi:hypothetical protein
VPTSRAAETVRTAVKAPVLTAPHAAVEARRVDPAYPSGSAARKSKSQPRSACVTVSWNSLA